LKKRRKQEEEEEEEEEEGEGEGEGEGETRDLLRDDTRLGSAKTKESVIAAVAPRENLSRVRDCMDV